MIVTHPYTSVFSRRHCLYRGNLTPVKILKTPVAHYNKVHLSCVNFPRRSQVHLPGLPNPHVAPLNPSSGTNVPAMCHTPLRKGIINRIKNATPPSVMSPP